MKKQKSNRRKREQWRLRTVVIIVLFLCLTEIVIIGKAWDSYRSAKPRYLAVSSWRFAENARVPEAVVIALATPEPTPMPTPTPTPVPEPDPYEVQLLAHLIYGEAGDQSDECQIATGAVVVNRMNHPGYPSTIEGVIFESGQYACTWDGNFDREPSQQAWDNARWVLQHQDEEIIPNNVIYQAQFVQGSGVWKKIGTEYFCFE